MRLTRNDARRVIGLFASVFLIAGAGCSKSGPAPGVTYGVSAIAKGSDGKVKQKGPVLRAEFAEVDDVQEVAYEGGTLSVKVQKTQFGRATFAITFSDQSTQTAQVKAGETKNILPKSHKVGVRIEVQEAR